MTKRILEPNTPGGARLDFRECSPAYFSDLTLRLTQGAGGGAAGITDITHVEFSVTFALTTDRRT